MRTLTVGKRRPGRPERRWGDYVKEDRKTLGKEATNRVVW